MSSPSVKRQKLAYHHKHQIRYRPPLVPGELALLPQELIDQLLVESIKSICEEQAYKQNIDEPFIDSVALEALRSATEEFVNNLCQKVRRSMLASRRSVPIAPDFDAAFHALDLPLPDDQLPPFHAEPEINRTLLPTPPPDDEFHETHELPQKFLGPELSRQQDLTKFTFHTASLPPLPSAHTYHDTPVYTERQTDSKRIRELATEEGKLGEQALRKLAGAVKLEAALSTEPETRLVRDRRPPRLRKSPVLTEEAMFEETMRDLLKQESGDFELGPIVSSEKQYRMPDEGRVKRRPVINLSAASTKQQLQPLSLEASKYNVLPPPLQRTKTSTSKRSEDVDLVLEL